MPAAAEDGPTFDQLPVLEDGYNSLPPPMVIDDSSEFLTAKSSKDSPLHTNHTEEGFVFYWCPTCEIEVKGPGTLQMTKQTHEDGGRHMKCLRSGPPSARAALLLQGSELLIALQDGDAAAQNAEEALVAFPKDLVAHRRLRTRTGPKKPELCINRSTLCVTASGRTFPWHSWKNALQHLLHLRHICPYHYFGRRCDEGERCNLIHDIKKAPPPIATIVSQCRSGGGRRSEARQFFRQQRDGSWSKPDSHQPAAEWQKKNSSSTKGGEHVHTTPTWSKGRQQREPPRQQSPDAQKKQPSVVQTTTPQLVPQQVQVVQQPQVAQPLPGQLMQVATTQMGYCIPQPLQYITQPQMPPGCTAVATFQQPQQLQGAPPVVAVAAGQQQVVYAAPQPQFAVAQVPAVAMPPARAGEFFTIPINMLQAAGAAPQFGVAAAQQKVQLDATRVTQSPQQFIVAALVKEPPSESGNGHVEPRGAVPTTSQVSTTMHDAAT